MVQLYASSVESVRGENRYRLLLASMFSSHILYIFGSNPVGHGVQRTLSQIHTHTKRNNRHIRYQQYRVNEAHSVLQHAAVGKACNL